MKGWGLVAVFAALVGVWIGSTNATTRGSRVLMDATINSTQKVIWLDYFVDPPVYKIIYDYGPGLYYWGGCADVNLGLAYGIFAYDKTSPIWFYTMQVNATSGEATKLANFTTQTTPEYFTVSCDSVWHKLVLTVFWRAQWKNYIWLLDQNTGEMTNLIDATCCDTNFNALYRAYDSSNHELIEMTYLTNVYDLVNCAILEYPGNYSPYSDWVYELPLIVPGYPGRLLTFNLTIWFYPGEVGCESIVWWDYLQGVFIQIEDPFPIDYSVVSLPWWDPDTQSFTLLKGKGSQMFVEAYSIVAGTRLLSSDMGTPLGGSTFTAYIPIGSI
ncbi:hypothetical protein Pelo_6207 [Pelomyxa schiedti]|nr:hypothetical protein Pelo_6207 [Pelomyxa schiedti]